MKYKVGDEVLMKAEITKVYDNGVVIKVGGLGEAFFANENIDVNKTYEMGLSDAWELAKKIYHAPCDGGLENSEIEEIFDCKFGSVTYKYTAEEALAKIEAYEKGKDIKVGDVVIIDDDVNAIVIDEISEESVFVLTENGCIEKRTKKYLEKTGKHIDIEGLLKQIGE